MLDAGFLQPRVQGRKVKGRNIRVGDDHDPLLRQQRGQVRTRATDQIRPDQHVITGTFQLYRHQQGAACGVDGPQDPVGTVLHVVISTIDDNVCFGINGMALAHKVRQDRRGRVDVQ